DNLPHGLSSGLLLLRRRPTSATVVLATHVAFRRGSLDSELGTRMSRGNAGLTSERGRGQLSRSLRFFWGHDKAVYHKAVGRLPETVRLHWPLQVLGLSAAFHSAASLRTAVATSQGRGRILAMLRKRQAADPDLVAEAFKAIPAEHLEDFEARLAQEPRRVRQARRRAAAETVEQRWERLLAHRRRLRGPALPEAEAATYSRRATEDRVRVRRKFFPARPKEVRHTGRQWSNPWTDEAAESVRDVADNDTGLPRAAITPFATMLEDWCKQGAWAICERCFSLEPRHLKEVDTRRVADPAVPNCRWCRRDGVESVPTVDRVPRQLRGLCHDVVAALRPFDIDCGPYQRPPHGYRVHTALLRLLWSDTDVEAKIAALEHRTWRTKAKKAFKFLMQHSCSEYRNFVTQHRRFLRDHPMPTDAARRRPLQTLEPPGIETALWPDLYYNSDLCESVERATDARRLQRQGLLQEDSDDDDREREDDPGRGSLRRSFLKKVLGPLHLEGPETLHLAHILLELLREWVAGGSRKHGESSKLWQKHLLCGGRRINFAARLEYQDAEQGVRAYGLEEVDILKGHVDNIAPQAAGSGGRGLLMRYVATYNVKFSSSFHNEMLADTGVSGYGMALRILSTLHPSEPEMWVTLFKQLFPDFALRGTMLPIVAPWPTMDAQPEFVRRYEECLWRSDSMSLLEYLRKTNAAGEVVAWIQKLHAAADSALDLGEFASVQTTFGEKVVAAETVSVFSDKYFGQWLMLHVPFRSAADFLYPDIVAKIPTRYQLFACAWRAAGDYWTDRARVREDMQLAAHKDATIANFLALLDAQREIVDQYLRGDISLEDEVPEPALPALPGALGLERPCFNRQQQVLERCALERLDLIQALKDAQTPAEADDAALRLEEQNSVLVCMGGPGTGKTFVADYLVRVAVRRGHRVLYALPTGQLACRMRQRHPDIHVDTCAGAFLFYRPESETLALMAEYDMVVIDEALQLSAEEYGACDHAQWRFTHVVTLTEVRRCKCAVLQAKLDFLRHHKPLGQEGKRFVNRLCYQHKAWTGHDEPTSLDIDSVFKRTGGKTTFVTCTKRGAASINALAVQVLFSNRKQQLLAEIPGDYDDNEENFDEYGNLRRDRAPLPNPVQLYRGLRVVLTRNRDKENHYVNGMVATVEGYFPTTGCLRVRTQTGRRLAIYRYTDTDVPCGRAVYFPIRTGYAGTIYKFQGAYGITSARALSTGIRFKNGLFVRGRFTVLFVVLLCEGDNLPHGLSSGLLLLRRRPTSATVVLATHAGLTSERGRGQLSRSLRFFWGHDKAVYHKAVGRLPETVRLHWPLQVLGLSAAFHSAASLRTAVATSQGRGRILAMLRKRQAADPDLVAEAFKAIPAEHLEDFEARLAQEPRRVRQARRRAAAETVEQRWERLLAHRRRLRGPALPEAEAATYSRRATEDRVRVRRKFFPARPKEVRHTGRQWSNPWTDEAAESVRDVADNDTGLPRAAITPFATMLEDWCKQGAWAICERCFSLEPRHLKEVDTRRVADPAVPNCRWCRRDGVESVPTVDRVPRQLRGLCHDVVAALRPFDIDCGPYQRPPHGYRVHTALLRLLWSDTDVEAKIAALEHRTWRTKAKKAFKFLMQHSCSEYRNFVTQHRRFLRDHPMPTDAARRRPLQTLETPGIETALWPDLYYNSDLCESVERATDARRLQRQGLLQEDSDDDDREREDDPGRGSLRRSFLKKVLGPLHLEGPETLHLAHILLELLREWVAGGSRKHGESSKLWQKHLLCGGRRINFAARLEYQDAEQGVRAYGLEEVDILKGHVDNIAPQAAGSGGRGLLMRYVATYNVKFSSSFHNEMLADTGVSGYGMALRILSTLHPSEPEMWVTLFKQLFPDFALGGTMLPIVAPWPTMDAQPEFVRRYEECLWRSDSMSLLEYLRKTNAAGEVVAWIQKLHAAADSALDLGEFASVQTTFGEKVVAAETVSVFSDKYFGQWLMLHVPFRSAADFLYPDIVAKIPTRYQLFACAWRAAGDYWTDRARVREDMQLAAHKDATIANFLALLDAQREIVDQYLRGDISLEDEVPEPALPALPGALGLERPCFNRQQQVLERCALERLDLIQALKDAQTPAEADDAALRLEEQNSVLVCMGGPGTGKTFVADYLVRVAVRRGHRVLYALPTGQLACRMRQRHPDIHVDTCAGAFLFYRPESETLALMAEYDMVVIDEALQLSAEEYGRLHAMFCATGKQLLLLLMGDDCQLPSIHPQQACDHAQWRFTHVVTLTEVRRCKCAVLQAKLDFLRHHKPLGQEGKRFVNRLCYQHKAWTGHDEPTSLDIDSVFKRTGGKTTFVTCTKRGAASINALAVQVLFSNRKQQLLAEIPGDYDDNEENFDEYGNLRRDRAPLPNPVQLYRGLRVVLTRNRDKENHYVNGMVATVEGYFPTTGCLRVRTQTGRRLAIYRYTDTDVPCGRAVYFPIRTGYAGTIYKFQGAYGITSARALSTGIRFKNGLFVRGRFTVLFVVLLCEGDNLPHGLSSGLLLLRRRPTSATVVLATHAGLTSERGRGQLSRSLRFFWGHDKAVYHKAVGRLPETVRLHWPLQVLGLSAAFHSAASLRTAVATSQGRGRILAMLRKRQAADPDLVAEAFKAIPAEHLEDFEARLAQEPRRVRQARRRAAAETVEQRWERLLAHRRRLRGPALPEAEAATYSRRATEDRVRVRRKFFPARPKEVRHTGRQWSNPWTDEAAESVRDVADNDTGLPRAAITPFATMLEDWCKQGAWAICERCFSLEPRHLKEVDTRRVADPAVPNCRWCRRDGVESVPTVDRVPRQLRGLCHDVVAALRPFDIDCGPYQRPPHGYRVHTALLRLLWSDTDVEAKIAALEHRTWRTKAKKAFKFLMQHSCSEYRNFVTQHRRFLRDHPMPTDAARRRPLQTLETPGIETALWPDLYYNSDLCESVERATDARRLQRQGLLQEDSDDDDREREDDPGRGSLRRSFLKKVLGPLHLEGPETLHLAHILLELLREWVAGGSRKHGESSKLWQKHLLCGGRRINFAARLEYQDAEQGVRAYGLEEVDILKGHVDNIAPQAAGSGGRGLLMRYVATYNVKFSSSFHNEMLADTGVSGYGMALRILSTLHPSEPEMWVTLFKQLFPDFALGGTMLPIVAPWPTMDAQPEFVRRYEECLWRSDSMSLLEYLRKTNAAGEVVAWIQKLHAAADSALDLGEFASVQTTFGEKVVAAETVSVFSDKYFGQWLMLHVPFRSAADFLYPDIVAKIPTRYQLFACAWRAAGDYWTDRARVREDMQLAAHKDATIANFLALLDAQREIVDQYLRGDISLEDEVPEPALPALPGALGLERPCFNRQQQVLERCALERLDLIQALKDAQTPAEADDAALRLEEQNSVLVCMGGPGTGKTFVADYLVRVAVRRGHRVLYALPTGQLACRMRQRHPDIHVDTCAGAFLFYRPESETLALMAEYDMVVIDEALQLSAEEYGRLHAMFCATGKQLLLLLMGDDCQLPSIHPQQACDHAQWRFTHVVTLTEVRRCKCAVLQAKLDFLRHHKPLGQEGKRFVNRLCYQHKAWTGHDEPTSLDIDSVFKRTGGKTTFVTCTKRGAASINALAVQVLFSNRKQQLLAEIPGDYDDNEENFDEYGNLRRDRAPLPNPVQLYRGLRVVLTRNRDKENHYVNGMVATVEGYFPTTGCLRVRTQTGRRLAIYRYTDTDVPCGRAVYFPIRTGYAGTIYKFQGAELEHVTLWLNRRWCRAAAYVALSRVARDENYLIGGIVNADHLIPAK
ncbi:pif1, partial [Symbiodinium sp. CCMP2592]